MAHSAAIRSQESRWGSLRSCERKAPIKTFFLALGFTLYVDLVFWASCTSAGFLYESSIKSMECKVYRDGPAEKLAARILVTVTGKDAWEFRKDDFQFFVGASRTPNDPPAPKWPAPFNPKRIGVLAGDVDTLEADDSSGSTLVEPGRWKLLKVTALLNAKSIEFLNNHSDKVRCTVSNGALLDYPIGLIVPLVRRADPNVLWESASDEID